MHEQQRNRRRRDARDPRGLPQCLGAVPAQFLPDLEGQCSDLGIVEVGRQLEVLECGRPLDFLDLLVEVASLLRRHIHLLDHGICQRRAERGAQGFT